ncbi:hypothetical protein ACFQZS_13845 [Mucilaginibacter calamicampi]|uniref:Uncharacterized protein n=1 Tax=Mucilaginibacter calamicampi TaxID=1302352 RepID=A0ABW2YXL0_9SPHI
MENSIEMIWKQGFLNENSLVAPRVNNLYNRKSINVVERIKQRMKNYRVFNYGLLIVILVTDYFMDIFLNGLVFCAMALVMIWYTRRIVRNIKTLDQEATSYDYLKSFDTYVKDIFARFEKIVRFSLPLYCLIGFVGVWAAWDKLGMFAIMKRQYPNANIELWGLAYLAAWMLVVILFSGKMYRLEVRLVYGRLFNKLEETITEMEKLKQGE